jgi:hypothetical protein
MALILAQAVLSQDFHFSVPDIIHVARIRADWHYIPWRFCVPGGNKDAAQFPTRNGSASSSTQGPAPGHVAGTNFRRLDQPLIDRNFRQVASTSPGRNSLRQATPRGHCPGRTK